MVARLIGTEGLFRENIAVRIKPSGAAAAAHILKVAGSAAPFEEARIPQTAEEFGVIPNIAQGFLAKIPGRKRQIAAGVDIPLMRDKAHMQARQAPLAVRRDFWRGVRSGTACRATTFIF